MKLSGELDYRIRYDVEHDLFHAQNIFNDEYIKPTFIEYVQKLEKENAELKADNDARKFAMAMSEKVEKRLREENAELKESLKKWEDAIYADVENYNDQLTKATEIIKKLYAVYYDPCVTESDLKYRDELFAEIKQFLNSDIKEG